MNECNSPSKKFKFHQLALVTASRFGNPVVEVIKYPNQMRYVAGQYHLI